MVYQTQNTSKTNNSFTRWHPSSWVSNPSVELLGKLFHPRCSTVLDYHLGASGYFGVSDVLTSCKCRCGIRQFRWNTLNVCCRAATTRKMLGTIDSKFRDMTRLSCGKLRPSKPPVEDDLYDPSLKMGSDLVWLLQIGGRRHSCASDLTYTYLNTHTCLGFYYMTFSLNPLMHPEPTPNLVLDLLLSMKWCPLFNQLNKPFFLSCGAPFFGSMFKLKSRIWGS